MSLDVYLNINGKEYYSDNITHNLNKMAKEAGIYKALWRPEEIGCTKAGDIIELLQEGLKKLINEPDHYKKFDSSNGWGVYRHLVDFTKDYLDACIDLPHANIEISR